VLNPTSEQTSAGYRDSIHGIVKVDDPTPEWAHRPATWSGSSESSGISSEEEEHFDKEMDSRTHSPNLPISKTPTSPTGPGAHRHGSLRNTIWRSGESKTEKKAKKKKQKWIFVADVSGILKLFPSPNNGCVAANVS